MTTEVKSKKTYTPEQQAELLSKWDGSVKGAKNLGVSFQTIKGWRDGKAPMTSKKPANIDVLNGLVDLIKDNPSHIDNACRVLRHLLQDEIGTFQAEQKLIQDKIDLLNSKLKEL